MNQLQTTPLWKAHPAVFPAPPCLEGASGCAFQGSVQKTLRAPRTALIAPNGGGYRQSAGAPPTPPVRRRFHFLARLG